MFVDASAIVAIIASESGSERLVAALERPGRSRFTSPLAIYEATLGATRAQLQGKRRPTRADIQAKLAFVLELLETFEIKVAPIKPGYGEEALHAAAHFGKAVGHPADLNFGDCFAYAIAKAQNLPILFTGNDFSQTDLKTVPL
jgi:ribonuclease VapC